MLGPVLAFRGEIEAQGRGSLHPHILVWLVCGHLEVVGQLASMLKNNKAELQHRLRHFMKMVVASFESLSHASVQAAPRIFDGASLSTPVAVTKVVRNLSKYDGGSDLDLLREMLERTQEQDAFLEAARDDDWRRPLLQVEEAANSTRKHFHTAYQWLASGTDACISFAQCAGGRRFSRRRSASMADGSCAGGPARNFLHMCLMWLDFFPRD